MSQRNASFFFAGGGTGGHIYPAMAVAEQLLRLRPDATIHFFCSSRNVDSHILSQSSFNYTILPAQGFSLRPATLVGFLKSFYASYRSAGRIISSADGAVVVGVGGFVAAPVCYFAHRHRIPLFILNVDMVPGRASRLIGRWADGIFVQFEDTVSCFSASKAIVNVVGCPLRSRFAAPDPAAAVKKLGLDASKKILLITGASSGSSSINETICAILDKLAVFSSTWQLVHITGSRDFDAVQRRYADALIANKVLSYWDDMPDLLAAADLVVGRSGAVSVAEYAACGTPSICMPYPHHRDRHQYLNAGKLVEAGAAVIVDDVPDMTDRCEWLYEQLEELMADDHQRRQMRQSCRQLAVPDAALRMAEKLLQRITAPESPSI